MPPRPEPRGAQRARGAAKKAKAERFSLSALGRELGVSHTAVSKAIRSGRLRKSIGHDARGNFVRNLASAKLEWAAGAAKPANGGGRGNREVVGTLVDAQLRVAAQRADSLELANRRQRGELLDAATVEQERFELARALRDRILQVPERLPDLDRTIRARILAELREALSILSDQVNDQAERE